MRYLRVILALAVLLTFSNGPISYAQSESHYFSETGHTVQGVFWQYWQEHGGLAQQGYPISDELQERSDLNGQTYTVQYFERAVFERHPENQLPYDVLLSQLGTFRYRQKYPNGAPDQHVSTENGRNFSETGHTIGGPFRTYWEQHGGLAQQGFPISDEFQERSDLNGQTYTVQYFERAVFEHHPENQPPYDVLLSQLGTFQHRAKYESRPEVSEVRVAGPDQWQTVFNWKTDHCDGDVWDNPDVPARAFRDSSGQVQLIASEPTNRRMIGPDLDHLHHECSPILNSHHDPDPSHYSDNEWIHSLYTLDGQTIYALIHNEYHGTEHPGQCPSGQIDRCFYNAVTLAISTNSGQSYERAAPDYRIASSPYRYTPDGGKHGVFNPSNIVKFQGSYYSLVGVVGYQAQRNGRCLMRTQDLASAQAWQVWDGQNWTSFLNPYQAPNEPPQSHVCQPIAPDEIGWMGESLTFNTYFNRFVLIGVSESEISDQGQVRGFYYSLSDNLIDWTPKRLLMPAQWVETWTPNGPKPLGYPSVLDPHSPPEDLNFETVGQDAYLYFVRLNDYSQQADRDLARVPIEFSK